MRGGRIAVATLGACALLPVAPAGTHPGHGIVTVAVGGFRYAPADVQLIQGDVVVWTYNAIDRNHSVTADEGQAMSFDSDPGKASGQVQHRSGDAYSVRFDQTGSFFFHCKVHPSMKGSVTVGPAPPGTVPAADDRPQLSDVSLASRKVCSRRSRRCAKPHAVLRLTLDRPASVRALIRRRGATLGETAFAGRLGPSTRRIALGRLRPGAYELKVVAIDDSSGLSSRAARVAFRVRS